jgi:hypothetical protein
METKLALREIHRNRKEFGVSMPPPTISIGYPTVSLMEVMNHETIKLALLRASSVVDHEKAKSLPYWDKMAEAVLANGLTEVETMARHLCRTDGNDPDKESKGLGFLIPKDQPYRLWQAWGHMANNVLAVMRTPE